MLLGRAPPALFRGLALREAPPGLTPGAERWPRQGHLRRVRELKAKKIRTSTFACVLSDVGFITEFHIDLCKTRVSSGQNRRGQQALPGTCGRLKQTVKVKAKRN